MTEKIIAGDAGADLRARVPLGNVFTSWCVACREEHPALRGLGKTGRANPSHAHG
jgi:thiol-disulfide isomerase/thioredoxin